MNDVAQHRPVRRTRRVWHYRLDMGRTVKKGEVYVAPDTDGRRELEAAYAAAAKECKVASDHPDLVCRCGVLVTKLV